MCEYCGCREFPVIATLTAEHIDLKERAGMLRRAVEAGDLAAAESHLDALRRVLDAHVDREERGLFAELAVADPQLSETVTQLCAEHRDIHAALRPPIDGDKHSADQDGAEEDGTDEDWASVLAALEALYKHIDKEENGLFPAAVILLPIPAWDRITAVS